GGVTDYDVLLGAAALTPSNVPTATQLLPLQLLLVKNRSTPESRRVTYKASFPPRQGYLIGNPALAGATLKLKVDDVTQCFVMPKTGWSGNGPVYKYVDRTGANGPVKAAWIKQGSNGAIQNKVVATGAHGQIDVVPPNPGVQGDANFHIGGGAQYCASTA